MLHGSLGTYSLVNPAGFKWALISVVSHVENCAHTDAENAASKANMLIRLNKRKHYKKNEMRI
jgi:hypothetical protein